MDCLPSQLAPHGAHHRFNRRILLSPALIAQHRLSTNQALLIRKPATLDALSLADGPPSFAIGFVWPAQQQQQTVQLSAELFLSAAIAPGEPVSLSPLPPINTSQGPGLRLPHADSLTLAQPEQLPPHTARLWQAALREALIDRKYLAINHVIAIPSATSQHCFCTVTAIAPASPEEPLQLYHITANTQLTITAPKTTKPNQNSTNNTAEAYQAIGGLQTQISQIRDLVELPLTKPELYAHFAITPPRGILLHGPPGTGKTHLASLVAKSVDCSLLTLSTTTISSAYHGEPEQKIAALFAEAKARSPSMVLIDEIDGLFPARDAAGEVDRRIVGALLTAMDGLDHKENTQQEAPHRVVVIATTNRPHALDPALRRPGRFDRELEIGIPDAQARREILDVLLRKTPHRLSPEQTRTVAEKTHGFVGADLVALLREAGLLAIKRALARRLSTAEMLLEAADVEKALVAVQPSAMRELVIETPRVTWADIGGQEAVKQTLVEALEWPALFPDTFQRLGIKPVQGILLYGPPGCSKTLIAKALAAQANANFIALKGSDVFNKFLGESEKAIRDLFRKARAAAPSIIFLDEIDSIAMARGSDDQAGGTGVADRVLTSLLVEMDGIEELSGVLVLAATNRPEVIDPALMRPGRLDRILYVGPPDAHSRAEILRINFRKMSVDPSLDTEGCTGAEMVAVCQQAAIAAVHRDKNVAFIVQEDFDGVLRTFRRSVDQAVLDGYCAWRDRVGCPVSGGRMYTAQPGLRPAVRSVHRTLLDGALRACPSASPALAPLSLWVPSCAVPAARDTRMSRWLGDAPRRFRIAPICSGRIGRPVGASEPIHRPLFSAQGPRPRRPQEASTVGARLGGNRAPSACPHTSRDMGHSGAAEMYRRGPRLRPHLSVGLGHSASSL
ncbi:hypothetical protein PtA15_10A480 [Puccinia triticina]|uniref:AAA+ ATPase domain-containing protein n=1 Tax=Puccinia triticina TaxID=208348 RepID=A0ABY7CYH5_9BASI|nr:uncharacterized protein PtA15_10A480 [Puccinia triticina]WAQ89057.1 hypothetical protein PtA15_10A480 [Puccinia triticina]